MRAFLPAALLGIATVVATPVHATAQADGARPFVVLQFQPAYPSDPNPAAVIYDRIVRQIGAEPGPRIVGGPSLAAELREGMAGCAVTPAFSNGCKPRPSSSTIRATSAIPSR